MNQGAKDTAKQASSAAMKRVSYIKTNVSVFV